MKPSMSIIIAASRDYRGKFLTECLRSVVLDGADTEIMILPFVPSESYGELINNAVSRSAAEFIMVLGADDKIVIGGLPALERAVDDSDVYYGDIVEFGDRDTLNKYSQTITIKGLLQDNMVPVTSLVRKSKWMEVGGYSKFDAPFPEDWDLWVKLIVAGAKFKHIGHPILNYRIHQNQAWNKMQSHQAEYKAEINKRYGGIATHDRA
jgi:hypothetical protein